MGLFRKKEKKTEAKLEREDKQESKILPKPKVCCVDIDDKSFDALKKSGYFLYEGTLGSVIKNIPYNQNRDYIHFSIDYDFPVNFHEYDILIIDLKNEAYNAFESREIDELQTRNQKVFSLICTYPTTIFDPRPLSSSILGDKIKEVQKKKFIQIVFAAKQYEINYEIIEISNTYTQRHPDEKHHLYGFNNFPLATARKGSEVSTLKIRDDIFQLLNKHLDGLIYEQTFNHPTVLNSEGKKIVPDEKFVPFLKNVNDEIVSFVQLDGNNITFVFPSFKDKAGFLIEFLNSILPLIYPDVFPFSTQFKWIESLEYYLPNHKELLIKQENLKEEFEKKIDVIEKQIRGNSKKFKFLHALITETGDNLVSAVFSFFKWLEFKDVIIKDEQFVSIKEEDIQVELDNGILVIEVKGIGGTSTDSACSQISKIKYRREKERKTYDVYALYIVNHQRYLPPLKRLNPPFSTQQITDAINEKRGLLSTWQLFNLYKEVNAGIISKEEVRSQILQYGHVVFKPKLSVKIGQPKEILKDGFVVILDISSTIIKVNDIIIIEKGGIYSKAKILSLQINDRDVQKVVKGEVGIRLDTKVTKNSTLWTQ